MIFDMATAAMARGEIMIAQREGHQLPEGVGLDANGEPSTDPAAVLAGAQLAFGGYKGAALALMVELMAGPLIGETLSLETKETDAGDGSPPAGGEFLIGFDPSKFGDAEEWQSHAEKVFKQIEDMSGARLPGSRRHQERARTVQDGVQVPAELLDKIGELTHD